jgi:hypothetical protein
MIAKVIKKKKIKGGGSEGFSKTNYKGGPFDYQSRESLTKKKKKKERLRILVENLEIMARLTKL